MVRIPTTATYALPSGNVAQIVRVTVIQSGAESTHWEVREYAGGDSSLVQRRNYDLARDAHAWVLSVGGVAV